MSDSLKLTRKDFRIVIYFIGSLVALYSLRFPDFAEEIIIGVLSSLLATLVLELEKLLPRPSPEKISIERRLKRMESSLEEIKDLLKPK